MPSPSSTGRFDSNSLGAESSFAPSNFRAQSVLSGPRYRELDRRQSYYDCTQHDHHQYDFDGRIIDLKGPGAMVTLPLLNAAVSPTYIPLRMRRPSAPARLAKVITNAFTNMVFGEKRFPSIKVKGDADTQDFDAEFVKASSMSAKMIRCRTLGGSVGTVGLSWCFDRKGRPRVETHNGKYLFAHSWEDREELIPHHVSEVYLTARPEWDGQKKRFVQNWYWHRRDWDDHNDILFEEVLYEANREPEWRPDPVRSVTHDDGFCHLSWIQNLPNEDVDGLPDYDGLFELFDVVDILNSVVSKGAVLNLDPTLILKVDRDILGAMGVQKGSDNFIAVGEEGGAEYLEVTGASLEAGIKLLNEHRRGALETAQCIVPDPADVAAQGVSSVALKAMFGPMLGKCDTLRDQYGKGMRRVLDQANEVARKKAGKTVTVYVKNPSGVVEEKTVQLVINLPQKIEEKPVMDEMGQPKIDEETGKPTKETTKTDRKPGDSESLCELEWPEYFPLTPTDKSSAVTALTTAVPGKAIMSQQSAVEQAAETFGLEPGEEWDRVQKDGTADKQAAADQAQAFGQNGDFGGGAPGKDGMPEGAKPKPFGGSKAPFGGKPGAPGGGKDPDDLGTAGFGDK